MKFLNLLKYLMMDKKFLWVEEYRPHTLQNCILPRSIKDSFQAFLEKGEIPNLLLAGTAGIGKTTVARAVCEELGASYIVINGSDEGRFLDTVRNKVKQFASTISLASSAAHKVVIIDEADNTTNDVQLSFEGGSGGVSQQLSLHLHLQLPEQDYRTVAFSMHGG